ncbi:MAG: acetolactate synthase [Rubellimicrobium sp.]|nr:acetolactate synthase [Rubellimicrobium sp.]
MRRRLWAVCGALVAAGVAPGGPSAAETFRTPSGLEVTLFDVVLEPEAGIARFRYLAPALEDGGVTYPEVAADFVWLCEAVGIAALEANDWDAPRIIVTLADRPVPFGEMDPDAIQFIDGFERQGGRCLWDEF